jgi:phage gp36-like protein
MAESIWVPINEVDMQRTCMNPLLNALRTAALGPGQPDPLIGSIADAVAEVRDAVESCDRNRASSDTTTVPPGLRATACWIALAYLAKRLSAIKLTEDQRKEISDARDLLKAVASCDRAVAKPSEPLTTPDVERGGGASVVAADPCVRTTTREQMSGL